MIFNELFPQEAVLITRTYRFLEPVRLRIKKDGITRLMGYGIGDTITVMEPNICFPESMYIKLTEIRLADGSIIVEFPENARTEVVYS